MADAPAFPSFKHFTIDDFENYQRFIYQFPQHCDFTINNLLIWLEGDSGIDFSWLNGNIIFKVIGSYYLDNQDQPSYILIGNHENDRTLDDIFNSGLISELIMVPDYFVTGIKSNNFSITEDESNKDYIIDIKSLLKNEGKKYSNFRHQISYFLKNHSETATIKDFDLLNPDHVKKIINSMHSWTIRSYHLNGNDPAKNETRAIDKLLKMEHIFPVNHQCIGLEIDGKLEGISIFHIPYALEKIGMGNHIKYNAEQERIFDFLVYATASRLEKQGIHKLNAEQDMGIEGIKKHKADLNPSEYYRKYSIVKP